MLPRSPITLLLDQACMQLHVALGKYISIRSEETGTYIYSADISGRLSALQQILGPEVWVTLESLRYEAHYQPRENWLVINPANLDLLTANLKNILKPIGNLPPLKKSLILTIESTITLLAEIKASPDMPILPVRRTTRFSLANSSTKITAHLTQRGDESKSTSPVFRFPKTSLPLLQAYSPGKAWEWKGLHQAVQEKTLATILESKFCNIEKIAAGLVEKDNDHRSGLQVVATQMPETLSTLFLLVEESKTGPDNLAKAFASKDSNGKTGLHTVLENRPNCLPIILKIISNSRFALKSILRALANKDMSQQTGRMVLKKLGADAIPIVLSAFVQSLVQLHYLDLIKVQRQLKLAAKDKNSPLSGLCKKASLRSLEFNMLRQLYGLSL